MMCKKSVPLLVLVTSLAWMFSLSADQLEEKVDETVRPSADMREEVNSQASFLADGCQKLLSQGTDETVNSMSCDQCLDVCPYGGREFTGNCECCLPPVTQSAL